MLPIKSGERARPFTLWLPLRRTDTHIHSDTHTHTPIVMLKMFHLGSSNNVKVYRLDSKGNHNSFRRWASQHKGAKHINATSMVMSKANSKLIKTIQLFFMLINWEKKTVVHANDQNNKTNPSLFGLIEKKRERKKIFIHFFY